MQDVIGKATTLGEAIAKHERTKAFMAADKAVHTNDQAKAVMEAFHAQAAHIHQLETSQQPIEPADKQKLAAVQAEMAGNDLIKNFVRCQADYAELMNNVNQAIDQAVGQAGQTGETAE